MVATKLPTTQLESDYNVLSARIEFIKRSDLYSDAEKADLLRGYETQRDALVSQYESEVSDAI